MTKQTVVEHAPATEKKCSKCKLVKPADRFSLFPRNASGLTSYCKDCHNESRRSKWPEYYAKNKAKLLSGWRKSVYGIDSEQFEEMLSAQGGGCAICRDPFPSSRRESLHVDHCHKTGRVRGLLCVRCNLGIGQLRDSPDLLLAAARYLTITQ